MKQRLRTIALWAAVVGINNLAVLLIVLGRSAPQPPSSLLLAILGVFYLPHIYVAMFADGMIRTLWPSIPYCVSAVIFWFAVLPVSYLYARLIDGLFRRFPGRRESN